MFSFKRLDGRWKMETVNYNSYHLYFLEGINVVMGLEFVW